MDLNLKLSDLTVSNAALSFLPITLSQDASASTFLYNFFKPTSTRAFFVEVLEVDLNPARFILQAVT